MPPEPPRSPRTGAKEGGYIALLETRITSLERALSGLNQDQHRDRMELRSLGERLSSLKGRASQYKQALAKDQACPECGQRVTSTHLKAKLSEALEATRPLNYEWTKLGTSTDERKEKIEEIEQEHDLLTKTLTKIKSIQEKDIVSSSELKLIQNQASPHQTQIEYLKIRRRETKEALTDATAKLEKQDALIKTYEFWQASFKEIRLSIIDDVLRELEMAVTRHITALGLYEWGIKFETERTTQSGSVSLSFTILLYPPDSDQPVKFESYSGGESQRLQLAVAFGLSEVLLERAGVSPNIEVLDEPTKGLSAQGVEDLLEHLQVRAKELRRALYFVDHHSLDRGAFDEVITIIKDKEGAHIQ